MNVKAGIIKTAFEEKAPFFNEAKVFAKRKIGKCVVHKQKAKTSDWYPEQHLEKYLHGLLKGDHSGVLHTVV
jgi:hypothetical protein